MHLSRMTCTGRSTGAGTSDACPDCNEYIGSSHDECVFIIGPVVGSLFRFNFGVRMRKVLKAIMVLSITVAVMAVCVTGACWYASENIVKVVGRSMHPTYANGDLLITKDSGSNAPRDSVVILHRPSAWNLGHSDSDGHDIVKRVVAVSGDRIVLDRDGRLLDGDTGDVIDSLETSVSLPECRASKDRELVVPQGHVLIRGDNVNNSYDSRWAWCNGEDPLVPVSDVERIVTGVIPVGRTMSTITKHE